MSITLSLFTITEMEIKLYGAIQRHHLKSFAYALLLVGKHTKLWCVFVCVFEQIICTAVYEHINMDVAGRKLVPMQKHAQSCVLS